MGYLSAGKRKYGGTYTKAQLEALTGMVQGDRAYMSDGNAVAERVSIMVYTGDAWLDTGMVQLTNNTGVQINENNLLASNGTGSTMRICIAAISAINALGICFSDVPDTEIGAMIQWGPANFIAGSAVNRGAMIESDTGGGATDGAMDDPGTGVGNIAQAMDAPGNGAVGRALFLGCPEKA